MNTSGILLLSRQGIGKQRNPTQSLITITLVATNKEDFGKPEFIFISNLWKTHRLVEWPNLDFSLYIR